MNAEIPKRKNLGRGLNALFGEQDDAAPATPIAATDACNIKPERLGRSDLDADKATFGSVDALAFPASAPV